MSNIATFGGLIGLGGTLSTSPSFFRNVFLEDGIDTEYRFESYGIRDKIYGLNVVYAFAQTLPELHSIKYIGKADDLADRMKSHERLSEAINAGANRLWVHFPGSNYRVSHWEAERRLIHRYSPPLNKHHTALDKTYPFPFRLGLLT